MKTKSTNEILSGIEKTGVITEKEILLIKRRSNNEQKDLFNYSIIDKVNNGYGIKVTKEQGEKGLTWLRKFIRKDGSSGVYGYRELNIINSANPEDFTFKGFWDAGNYFHRNYLPIYNLNGLEYIALKEPYIIG